MRITVLCDSTYENCAFGRSAWGELWPWTSGKDGLLPGRKYSPTTSNVIASSQSDPLMGVRS